MFITRKLRSAVMPVAVAAAAAMAPGIASADAVAQSYLFLSNFTFTSNNAVTPANAVDSGDVSASINGGAPATDTFNSPVGGGDFSIQKSVGPNAGTYVPGAPIVGAPLLNFVGSYASVRDMANNPAAIGDPFAGNVFAGVDNTVSLTPGGEGTAISNTNLSAAFQITVASGTILGVNFTADSYLRAMLDPLFKPGSANASYRWDISLRNAAGAVVFAWAPDGDILIGPTGGSEVFDPFDLTDDRSVVLGGFDFNTGIQNGYFEARTNALAGGLYTVNITHLANADASINIPEPGSLSLAALALIGMGVVSRRRKVRQ